MRIFIGVVTGLACLLMFVSALGSSDEPALAGVAVAAAVAYLAGLVYFSAQLVANAIGDRNLKTNAASATKDAG